MKKLLVGVMALTMFGCGVDSLRRVGGQDAAPPEATPDVTRSPPKGRDAAGVTTTLRLQGTDIGAYRAVLAQVRDARVLVDGRPVDVELAGLVMNLARSEHAWPIGTFALPKDAQRVEIQIWFDDEGGYETDVSAGVLDLRIPPLRFDAPASSFAEHSHAVVHLNLNRSLKAQKRDLLLLPDFQVHY